MAIEVVTTCPLGSQCEKIEDDKLLRCAWYVKLEGNDPQTGDKIDESRCAMAWLPVVNIEGNGIGQVIASSIQSMRNETLLRQDKALEKINAQISTNK